MNRYDNWNNLQIDMSRQFQRKQENMYSRHTNLNANDLFMEIESRLVGLVIGKGGKTINRLKKDSGAYISIIDCDSCESKRVQISGDKSAIQNALKLINDLIGVNNQCKMQNISQSNDGAAPKSQFIQSISNFDWAELMKEQAANLQNKLATLPPIIKNFYEEQPEVTMMTDQEVEDFRLSKNNIIVKYINENNIKPIPKPVMSFSLAFKNYPEILEEIKKQKFETPSPVQCQAWPIIMSGHDLIAIAQTGTGKTLAFLLPALIHLELQPTPRSARKGPSILLLAPTRELVLQIENEVNKYSYKGIKAMSIYGGASSLKQKECLRQGVEIVIATPGRLNDFVCCGAIDLSDVTILILDEADRMLDLGFEPQIRVTLLRLRPDRQTIMTSATWPSTVKELATNYTTNPIQVVIGSLDLTTVNTVKQEILIMQEEEKIYWLNNFLRNISSDDKIIIFVNQKVTVDILASDLLANGFYVESIHGGRDQHDREQALNNLRNGTVSVLIATDVASRGIDINDITVVVNYDFTKDIEEYVHRVGRTGRAGKIGLAITLITRRNWNKAKDLVEVLEKSEQVVPDKLYDMVKKFEIFQNRQKDGQGIRPFRKVDGDGNCGSKIPDGRQNQKE